jgi:hypothetical protein
MAADGSLAIPMLFKLILGARGGFNKASPGPDMGLQRLHSTLA